MSDAAILNEEVRTIRNFLTGLEDTESELEKLNLVNELFNYIHSTRKVLTNAPSLRQMLLTKITEFSKQSSWGVIKDAAARVCTKLNTEFGEPYSPGCLEALDMAPPPHPFADMRALGEGSFGAVFKPALPNKKNGAPQTYPDNVTKAFYRKANYNALVEKIPQIHNLMGPNEGHRINTYSETYKAGNLPDPIFDKLKRRAGTLNRSNKLHIIRMPDLGVDIAHIKNVYKEPRKLPFGIILEQIQKVIHQTARLAERYYGHFDIRDLNVMMNPKTGMLTIIDFDWLLPFETLYDEYDWGFYNQPPEALLRSYLLDAMEPPDGYTIQDYFIPGKLDNYLTYNLISFQAALQTHYKIANQEQLETAVIEAVDDSVQYLKSLLPTYGSTERLFMDVIIPTNDNYGLGLTLLQMISHVYVISSTDKTMAKNVLRTRITNGDVPYSEEQLSVIVDTLVEVIDLLKRMASMKLRDRINPADAKTEIDRIVTKYNSEKPAMNNNARAELNRMAFLAGNMPVVNNNATPAAMNENVRQELNRLRLLEGVMPSPPKSTRKGRRSRKARKTYRRRR
jgi:hypothetical protein